VTASSLMRSLFSPFSLLSFVCETTVHEEIRENAEEEKAADWQKKEFFGFLVF